MIKLLIKVISFFIFNPLNKDKFKRKYLRGIEPYCFFKKYYA